MPFLQNKKNILKQYVIALVALGLAACSTSSNGTFTQPSPYDQTIQRSAHHNAIRKYEADYSAHPEDLSALLGLARSLRYAGQAEQAAAMMNAKKSQFGDHPAFLTELGKSYLASGQVSKGKKALERSVKDNKDNWEAYSALGIVYDYEGRYDKAIESYMRAAQLCPDSASILNNMAISTGLTGNIAEARNLLLRASALQPQSERIKKNISLFRQLEIRCPDCDADDYRDIVKSTIVSQDWSYGDLACTTGAQEIMDALTNSDFVDVRVEFEFDKADLRPEAVHTLRSMAEAFSSEQLHHLGFVLEGHTDAVGTESYNQDLSERRAKAVKDYLVNQLGIQADRLGTVGYGETRLLDPEHPTSGANRRVRIVRIK